MSPLHIEEAGCRAALEELWARWPFPEDVPAPLAARLDGCPACRAERDEFRALCAKARSESGAPLTWSALSGARRGRELARATERALLAPTRPAARPIVWAPALAAGALALVLFRGYEPSVPDVVPPRTRPFPVVRAAPPPPAPTPERTPEPPATAQAPARRRRPAPVAKAARKPVAPRPLEVPLDVVENSEFFENLPLLEDWGALQAARAEGKL